MQLSQFIRQQLTNRYNCLANAQFEDLVLELVNDTQLLAWPSFRSQFATQEEEEYLTQASAYFTTHSFARKWLPHLLHFRAV